jgi:N-acetylglutamate synthase-like GNAT family acetyltransferase
METVFEYLASVDGAGVSATEIIVATIGYVASITIAISLLLKSMIRLRWINMGGAVIFVGYGLLIGSFPVALLNAFCVLINLFHIHRYYKKRDYFRLLKMQANAQFFREFLHFYKHDIQKFFPDFEKRYNEGYESYYILRNMIPAGVLMFDVQENKTAEIILDYVTPEFRDKQVGKFLFSENSKYFTNLGIESFYIVNPHKKHIDYLESISFKRNNIKPDIYEIELSKIW